MHFHLPHRLRLNFNLKDYIIIVAGMAIYAIGFTVFVLPHSIVVGGMAGFSTLVYFATKGFVPVAVTMYGVNLLMLLLSFRILGVRFVQRTVFGATVLSLFIGAIEGYFTSHAPIITDPTMSVLMGSVIMGFGIGLYYSHGGSAGGTDIVAALCEKKWKIDMGRTMMIIDVAIVASSFFLPFEGDIDARIQDRAGKIIYGWTSIVIYSWIANYFVNANRQTIQFLILSDKWKEITDRIMHETGRGSTSFECCGEWTGETRRMVIVWSRQFDAPNIYEIVHRIDSGAYVVQSEARNLFGNGFDRLRVRRNNQMQTK